MPNEIVGAAVLAQGLVHFFFFAHTNDALHADASLAAVQCDTDLTELTEFPVLRDFGV